MYRFIPWELYWLHHHPAITFLRLHILLIKHFTNPNKLFLDAKEGGNETRYLNDHRGTGEKQNVCFVRVKWDGGRVSVKVVGEGNGMSEDEIIENMMITSEKGMHEGGAVSVGVMVTRDVAKGEELLCDYGPTFWEE